MQPSYFLIMLLPLWCIVCINHCNCDHQHKNAELGSALTKADIVPQLINAAPFAVADVSYGNGHKAKLGNELTTQQVRKAPTVTWPTGATNSLFTVVLFDPDAPVGAQFLHWLIVNVPGNNIQEGETLASYYPPTPPKGSGAHRYIFLIYAQPQGSISDPQLAESINQSANGRNNFNVTKFAAKHKLADPAAGNFFRAKFDG